MVAEFPVAQRSGTFDIAMPLLSAKLMIRALIVMALDVDQLNFPLPFVSKTNQDVPDPALEDNFDDPRTGSTIMIYTNPTPQRADTPRSLFLPLPDITNSPYEEGKEKVWLHQFLDFRFRPGGRSELKKGSYG